LKNFYQSRSSWRTTIQIFSLKKLVSFFAILFLMQLASNAQAQGITLNFKAAPLEEVINSISKQTRYNFFYDADFLKKANPVTINVKSSNIGRVLSLVFADQPFTYQVNDKSILLKNKTNTEAVENTTVDKIVHGMVKDTTGMAIPGAVITLKGTNVMTQTDGSGHFYLRSNTNNPTIIVKYMGFVSQELNPRGEAAINVVLTTDAVSLDDIVVTGYQKISKDRSAASITKLDNELLNKFVNPSLTAALEGKVAGLSLYKNNVVLRGISTFSPSVGTTPLIVLDGLPTETTLDDINPYDVESVTVLKDGAATSIYGSRAANGVIIVTTKKGVKGKTQVTFNTDFFITDKPDLDKMHYASTSQMVDYESAIYQSELSKYAGSTKGLFDYYGGIGTGSIRYYSPIYALYRNQADGKITADQLASSLDGLRNNDYYSQYVDQAWQNESRQRYNLALSSGSEKNNTYLSFNYDKSNPQVRNNESERFNMYLKSEYQLSDRFRATFGVNTTYNKSTSTNGDYDTYTIQPRYASITDAAGNRVYTDYVNISQGVGNLNSSVTDALASNTNFKSFKFNVLDELERGFTKSNTLSVRAFANLEYKIVSGLKYSVQGQYELNKTNLETFSESDSYAMRYMYNAYTSLVGSPATGVYTHNIPDGGRLFQQNKETSSYTFRNQLDYSKSFGIGQTRHDFVALAGFEARQTLSPILTVDTRYGYNTQTLGSILIDEARLKTTGIASYPFNNNITLGSSDGQINSKHRNVSMYANMSYTLNDLYNLTGSIRVDQADLFGSQVRSQFRPLWSLGAGWNASKESFLADVNWLSYLKVRATYGIGGNVDQLTTSNLVGRLLSSDRLYPNLTYLSLTELPNPLLRWEKTATTNVGVDYALFKNRIHGTIDAYYKYSSDLLISTALDPTVGSLTQTINNGSLSNKGIEFSIGSDWFKHGDWTLSSNFVFAYNRNQVEKVDRSTPTGGNYVSAPSNYFFANTIYNSLYVYKYAGMTDGYPIFLDEKGNPNVTFDANGTPTILGINSPLAIQRAGSLTPTFNGSFNQTIRYKSFELGAMFIFYGGNKLRRDVLDLSGTTQTDVDLVNRWTESNPNTTIPRLELDYPNVLKPSALTLSSLYRYADIQVASASFVRLRNISFSYAVPKSFLKKLSLQQVKITAQANNPFLWAAAGDDIDPETYSLNSGTRNLNTPKSYLLGLAVTF